jgi:hypothetical protein
MLGVSVRKPGGRRLNAVTDGHDVDAPRDPLFAAARYTPTNYHDEDV